jgi:hypothetical protein
LDLKDERAFRLAVGIAIVRKANGELFLRRLVGPGDLRVADQAVAEEEAALDFRIPFGVAVKMMAAASVRLSGEDPPPGNAPFSPGDVAQIL